jgi:hypothetical protein
MLASRSFRDECLVGDDKRDGLVTWGMATEIVAMIVLSREDVRDESGPSLRVGNRAAVRLHSSLIYERCGHGEGFQEYEGFPYAGDHDGGMSNIAP